MKTIFYLAMTAQELSIYQNPALTAYMACHFSPYGSGLADLPESIPEGAMVILNDRIPMLHHDCHLIASQLASLSCESILLDLQNTQPQKANALIDAILQAVRVPEGVSEQYAAEHPCAVFLPARDADLDPFKACEAWPDREIWMDLSPGFVTYRIDYHGSQRTRECMFMDTPIHPDSGLLCHYSSMMTEAEAMFSLYRTWEDIAGILEKGKKMGVTRGIGLFREWQSFFPESGNK